MIATGGDEPRFPDCAAKGAGEEEEEDELADRKSVFPVRCNGAYRIREEDSKMSRSDGDCEIHPTTVSNAAVRIFPVPF